MNPQPAMLLILDLDETLIHAVKEPLPGVAPHFHFDRYFVYCRPHLEQFLIEAARHFRLAVWSSAGDIYVEEITRRITPEGVQYEFVWGRSRCSVRKNPEHDTFNFEKRLQKLKRRGFSLERMLIVDDSPEKTACNFGNAVYIRPFTGDPADRELLHLLDYLHTLKDLHNVRQVEKRGWRSGKNDP